MTTELDNLHNDADGVNEKNISKNSDKDLTASETENTPAKEAETESEKKVENQSETSQTSEEERPEDYKTESNKDEDDSDEDVKEESIPQKDYAELPIEVLIGEARELLKNYPARKLRDHFRQIREAAFAIFDAEEKEKKEAFVAEGGEPLDFHYHNPLKSEFNAVYGDYRRQLDAYFKELEKTQQENLEERNQIIEELKALYTEPNEDISNVFKKFRELKTRWHNAGSIPKAQAGNVFRTYFHHLDNFYEYLDLNKELRELDYAHNLEVRHSIIKRAEELVKEDNVQKALNELQYLHRLWKEEAVPVAEEHREPTWQVFKELTNKIHDRKSEISEKLKAEQEENLKKKEDIIAEIRGLLQNSDNKNHGEWQSGIRKLNSLRDSFLAVGRVPREHNQRMWNEFKEATREFNHKKNEFYKNLKAEQQSNLEKKMELLEIAKEHADSTDWNKSVQVVKRIQSEWKKIGHVPRKHSDKIWKEFKTACNKFFDNYKDRANRASQAQLDNLEKKEAILEELKAFKPTEEVQENLDKINEFNIRWNSVGKVPSANTSINSEYNKLVNELVKSFGLTDNEVQDFKMSSLVDQIKSDLDGNLLDEEIKKSRKKIEDLEKEITQLENNVSFFANADENSPLLRDVYRQIEEKRNLLTEAEIKLRRLHQIDLDEEEAED